MPTFIHYTAQDKGKIFHEYSGQEQGQQYIQGQHDYTCVVIMTTDKIFDIDKLQIRAVQIQVQCHRYPIICHPYDLLPIFYYLFASL